MKRNKKSISLYVLLGLCLFSAHAQDTSDLVKLGDQVPDFYLKNNEEIISPQSLEGKVVVIDFFATWCPPCIKELPLVEKYIWNKYKDNQNFKLLVVGRNHSKEELTKFGKDKFTMPFYPDKERVMYSKFAINTIPRNYVLNKSGKIIYSSSGFTMESFNKMLEVIEKELKL